MEHNNLLDELKKIYKMHSYQWSDKIDLEHLTGCYFHHPVNGINIFVRSLHRRDFFSEDEIDILDALRRYPVGPSQKTIVDLYLSKYIERPELLDKEMDFFLHKYKKYFPKLYIHKEFIIVEDYRLKSSDWITFTPEMAKKHSSQYFDFLNNYYSDTKQDSHVLRIHSIYFSNLLFNKKTKRFVFTNLGYFEPGPFTYPYLLIDDRDIHNIRYYNFAPGVEYPFKPYDACNLRLKFQLMRKKINLVQEAIGKHLPE